MSGLKIASSILLLLAAVSANAGSSVDTNVLRVCADPNNLPFSNSAGEGFENHIAKIIADDLGVPVEYELFPQRMGFIRNTLRKESPDREGYKCDLVMGVPAEFELAITTKPYYRSTYALVYAKGRGMDGVKSGDEFIALDNKVRDLVKIGLFARTPASDWVAKNKLFLQAVPYAAMSGDPESYPGELVEKEIAKGTVDAAIVWGPIAGYFSRPDKAKDLVMVPLYSEPGMHLDFAISMGVRFGESAWRDQLQEIVDRNSDKIVAVLREFNVPLVDENGAAL